MTLGKDIAVGIIGLGNMGKVHARMISDGQIPGLSLAAVADINPQAVVGFSEIPAYASSDELLADAEVDAVLIATPHYQHTPLGIAALAAGKHVLVEKPISVHKADCEKLIAAYDPDSGLVFAAMFNQRTDPRYRKLKNFAAAIRGEQALIAPAQDGIQSVELAKAMLLSSFKNRTVELPIDSGEYDAELQQRIKNSTYQKKSLTAEITDDFNQSF